MMFCSVSLLCILFVKASVEEKLRKEFLRFFLPMNMSKVNKAIKKLEEMDYHSHSFASKSVCREIYGTAAERI